MRFRLVEKILFLEKEEFEIQGDVLKKFNFSGNREVIIPNNVKVIGRKSFANKTEITSVVIPDNVNKIEHASFFNCSSLKDINLPDTITQIDGYAFSGCSSLVSISIPKNIEEIMGDTFSNCKSLKTISIPKSISNIQGRAFFNCTSLDTILYEGSEDDWEKIKIDDNDDLLKANIKFNISHKNDENKLAIYNSSKEKEDNDSNDVEENDEDNDSNDINDDFDSEFSRLNNEWDSLSDKDKQKKLDNIFKTSKHYPKLKELENTIIRSIDKYGFGKKTNQFLNFILDIVKIINVSPRLLAAEMEYLYGRFEMKDFKSFDDLRYIDVGRLKRERLNNSIKLQKDNSYLTLNEAEKVNVSESNLELKEVPFLENQSLYNREISDFRYTFQIILLMSNYKNWSKYFDNLYNIDTSKFFDGDKIKTENEIRFMVNDWSRDNEEANDENDTEKTISMREALIKTKIIDKYDVDSIESLKNKLSEILIFYKNKINGREVDSIKNFINEKLKTKENVDKFLKLKVLENNLSQLSILKTIAKYNDTKNK